jgi:hypothetical protein
MHLMEIVILDVTHANLNLYLTKLVHGILMSSRLLT